MKFEEFTFLVFIVTFVVALIYFGFTIHKDFKIEKEIIKYSEEYVQYNECTEIQGKYYCK